MELEDDERAENGSYGTAEPPSGNLRSGGLTRSGPSVPRSRPALPEQNSHFRGCEQASEPLNEGQRSGTVVPEIACRDRKTIRQTRALLPS